MTTSMSAQAPTSPLHLLANVVIDMDTRLSSCSDSLSSGSSSESGSTSPLSRRSCSASRSFLTDVTRLHIPCKLQRTASQAQRPLSRSTSSNHLPSSDPNFVPYVRHKRKGRRNTDLHMKSRMQMKAKRRDLLEKATKIKSLDNSPVNERQLLVLRMCYDEITMYPCESWMVLVAIIINRAYKQVKNWFSNERQKCRTGESIPYETEDGDKVRMRTSALSVCQDWSDSFFEEVVMIYNYRVQRNSHCKVPARRAPTSSSSENDD